MILRMIKNSIAISSTQKLMAFATITLATMLIACMLNITLKIGDEISSELRSYGSNILVIPQGENLNIQIDGKNFTPLRSQNFLDEKEIHKIKEIFWRNNIVAFAPFLEGFGRLNNAEKVSIVGTYFNKNLNLADEPDFSTGIKTLYPYWSIDGMWARDNQNEAMIGDELANKLNIKLGDTINISSKKLLVTAILHSNTDFSQKILMPLKIAQEILNKPDQYFKAEVSAITIPENDLSLKARKNIDDLDSAEYDQWYCSAYVGSIAYQIEEELKGASAKASLQVSESQSNIVKKIQNLMGIVSIMALVVSAIGITSLMTSDIHRRKKEIGLLKALGASNFEIYTLFASEGIWVALFAGVCGAILGYLLSFLLSFFIFDGGIGIALIVMPLSVSFAILISIFGSIVPMRSLVKLLPAEVLYDRK